MAKHFTLFAPTGALFLLLWACQHSPPCPELRGRWTTREGQEFLFLDDGTGWWLTQFGSLFDSVGFTYRLDCGQTPAALDFTGFKTGPYVGKTLFGIVLWSSDSSFQLTYEAGTAPAVRPAAFCTEQATRLFKVQENR